MIKMNTEELMHPAIMLIATDILKNEQLVSIQMIPHHSLLYKAQEILVSFYEKWNEAGRKMHFTATYLLIAIEGITEEKKDEFNIGLKEKLISMKGIAPRIIEIIFLDLEKGRTGIGLNLADPKDQWVKFIFDPSFFKNMSKEELANYPFIKEAIEKTKNSIPTEEDLIEQEKYREWVNSFKTK